MKTRAMILTLALMIVVGAAQPAQGQGFLRGLRERVAGALGGQEQQEQQQSQSQSSAFGFGAEEATTDEQTPERVNPAALVKSRLAATASWDDVITPSSASTHDALIRELPGLPTVADLVNPDPAKREAYYRRIAAVNMRVEQLSAGAECSEGEMDAFMQRLYEEQAARYGISVADLRALDSGTLSPQEQERIAMRIAQAMMGDMSGVMAMAAEGETMLDENGEMSQQDAMALLAKHGGSLNLGQMMGNMQAITEQAQRQTQLQQRLVAIQQKMIAANTGGPTGSYESIAGKYEANLARMYAVLCTENDPAAIDSIYRHADALVKNFRREAATTHLAGLQRQMEALAAAYPEMLALEADLVAEGLMAPCMQRRSSYNIVSGFANILDGAYRDFPQMDVLPVCREVILELPENEALYAAESGFATSVDGFLEGSDILVTDTASGVRYVYEGRNKRPLGTDEPQDFSTQRERAKPTYGRWTSAGGTRTVDYQRDGALMLHDGTIFYPLALEVEGSTVVWISQIENRIEKCTYKL